MIALKPDIAREFGSASKTYERVSRLQRLMGDDMIQRLGRIAPAGHVLDLGCGTGWFTRQLADMLPDSAVTGMDLSPGMIDHASQTSKCVSSWLVGDAEHIPFPDDSVDLLFSNLMLQWCADPRVVFRECRRVLRPGGRLMISSLLDGTLAELRQAWAAADHGVEHVNQFLPETDFVRYVDEVLPGARVDARSLQLEYDSPMGLVGELKKLGAGYKGGQRRMSLTGPGRWRRMCDQYPLADDGRVLGTYEAVWVDWKA
ncbi:biotin synthesis protein [Marinobacter nitratireducens]|uniref:Malonyl-[acyl-carrier protein] O-methyltransferase n=1 Tax=Marinobacter nitratireducens TaxID=1137280 RepID=A0A072NEM7_9GAMM|nr:malonyl-ACP O-methyltransferase BioC [Marinobacter nitratireducens]KEF31550.1 biotin synthesis protein [Marinobacter nitratireducens]